MLGFCASFRAGRVSEARICIKLLIAYLAFVNEFIPDWQVMTDTIIKTDNITGKFANFSVFFSRTWQLFQDTRMYLYLLCV